MCPRDARDRRACIARMIAVSKMRLVHDPSVGVSDLMMPIKNMISAKDDRNIYKLVMPPPGVTWKSATPVTWMANLSALFKDYVRVAPNTVLSAKKHKQALVRLDDTEKLNYTRKVQADFVDAVDDALRCGLAHFRSLKQMDDAKTRAFRKADEEQKRAIQEVLDLIHIEKGQEHEVASQQLVPVAPAQTPSPSPALNAPCPPKNQPSSSRGFDAVTGTYVGDYESVFDAVLTDGTSRSLEKEFETEVGPDNCTITYLGKTGKAKASLDSPAVKKKEKENKKDEETPSPQKDGPFQLALTDAEKKLLEKAQDASPIAKNGKTQQQRLNAQKPPKKGKGRGKGKEKEQKETSKPVPPKKRPSSAMLVQPKSASKPLHQKIAADPSSFELVLPEHLPDPTAGIPRPKARNAYVSWAYHHSKTAAKHTGCKDDETLAAVGRRAHGEAGKIFDQAWPKEEDTTATDPTGSNTQQEQIEEVNEEQSKKKAKMDKTKKNKKNEKDTSTEVKTEKTEEATPRVRRRVKTKENTEGVVRDVD